MADKRPLAREAALKISLLLVSLALVFGALEVYFHLYYLKIEGKPVSVSDKMLTEKNDYLDQILKKGSSYSDILFPHPYVSYVHDPTSSSSSAPINNVGLFGRDFPGEKEPGTFVILLTGGSVAAQLAGSTVDQNILEQELNRHYTNEKIKKFIVLNGAAGAWHQPQQFILFALHAHVLDGVIVLDGFNEHYLIDSSYNFGFPADNYYVAMANQFRSSDRSLWALRIDGWLRRLQSGPWLFHDSKTLYFMISQVRNKCRGVYLQANQGNTGRMKDLTNKMFLLPSDWRPEKKKSQAIAEYQKYIRMMKASADAMGVANLFLIQPCPAIGKPLSDDERRSAGDLSYRGLYQDMTDALLTLNGEKIPVRSLLDVFEGRPETIYRDAVHASAKGYALMNERILRLLESEWGLERT